METEEIVSLNRIDHDSQAHIKEMCKIIDHAKHTKFKYIDLKLLKDQRLMKNSQYSYLFGVLQKFKPETSNNVFEIKAMVELSEMLRTCQMLSPLVMDSYLAKVVGWFSQKQANKIENKILQINSQRSKTTTGRENIKKDVFQRPKTGITKINQSYNNSRPLSAAYGNMKHKYRPISGTYTTTSTKVTKNATTFDIDKTQDRQDSRQESQASKHSKENDENDSFDIDGKTKLFMYDTHQIQQQIQQQFRPRKGDFQHTDQGDLILHQITGNQKHSRQNRNLKSKVQYDQVKNLIEDYQRNKTRITHQSSRRIQSAKAYRNIKMDHLKIRASQNYLQQNQNIFTIQQPIIASKRNFTPQRPVSAMIKYWTKDVKSHINQQYSSNQFNSQKIGYSLTRPVTAVVRKQPFNPLSSEHLVNQNLESLSEIDKIKRLLAKKGDVPLNSLMKALVYDQNIPNDQNLQKPKPQLISNPFMKKKKKKKIIRKKKVL